ncbi:MAG TPA: hypothetical protein VFQ86_10940 [Arachidicoccus soli]|uniref:hypothetical protein n=1 Tax=Arachidicoccus soli TaxID=2341117 RepID=UPI0013C4FD07|nr:hypothetical protein [Arachidicoccus soli]HEU0228247.1 hypothetical protein [Arachidicoccus soli]
MRNIENKKIVGNKASHVRDYGNEPYFVKKANKSKAFLEKNGFPQELLKKINNNSRLSR